MKKIVCLFFFTYFTLSSFSQTLFTYGNNTVSKAEFLKAYNKNKPTVPDKPNALRDYLNLYIRFKLKVKEAKNLHLDTLPNLVADLQNFKSQIEESYLDDESEINKLVQEAFTRSQKDIHVAYMFIPIDTTDTIKAFNAAQTAYKNLSGKHISFKDAVTQIGDKSITASQADAGYITVFNLPYEFENIVYNLSPGQISKPYRSKKGYHIFQNIAERKSVGKIKVAQILFALPPGANADQQIAVQKQADSVYKLLLKGADFSELARSVSNDKVTFMNGGIMPEFGTGKFDTLFEKTAFALQKDSDISAPFKTEFGYHILKRLSLTPVTEDKNDAAWLSSLRQQVKQDSRAAIAKEKFVKEILTKISYKKNININENDLWKMTDSFIIGKTAAPSGNLNEKTTLFSFGTNPVKVKDWLLFVKDYKNASGLYKGESYNELLNKYVSQTATETYRKKLEDYNPDFKYQIEEFKDGNMLFEIMERNVWSKASDDSIGLRNFYAQNKTKYYWETSADAVLFSCANVKIAEQAAEDLRNGKKWNQLVIENSQQIQTDSGRFELSQIPVLERTNFTEGLVTAPVTNATDGTASFAKIIKLYSANQQRSFEEARGLVINDYQNFLEEKWIAQLKKKYPVTINEKLFKTIPE